MAIKVHNSTDWDVANDVHIHNGTSFERTKRVLVHNGTDFVEQHRSNWSYTYTSDTNQVDLDELTDIDKFYDVTITIDEGVTIYSDDTTIPAFKTGSGYGGTLTIINNGYIYGAGGVGGAGGADNGSNGSNGND